MQLIITGNLFDYPFDFHYAFYYLRKKKECQYFFDFFDIFFVRGPPPDTKREIPILGIDFFKKSPYNVAENIS